VSVADAPFQIGQDAVRTGGLGQINPAQGRIRRQGGAGGQRQYQRQPGGNPRDRRKARSAEIAGISKVIVQLQVS
jgi:hypothetical protein